MSSGSFVEPGRYFIESPTSAREIYSLLAGGEHSVELSVAYTNKNFSQKVSVCIKGTLDYGDGTIAFWGKLDPKSSELQWQQVAFWLDERCHRGQIRNLAAVWNILDPFPNRDRYHQTIRET